MKKPPKLSLGLKRLMDAANVLWASSDATSFNMRLYINSCRTPACVLGHYASWKGQEFLKFVLPKGKNLIADRYRPQYTKDDVLADYKDGRIARYFGIDIDDTETLFDPNGCGNAQTPWDAACYIRQFIEDRKAT
jgi:hypothetical protein